MISFRKIWEKLFAEHLDRIYSNQKIDNGLPYLRNKLFLSILLISVPICILAYIPSIIISILEKQFFISFLDTFAILFLLFFFQTDRFSITTKKVLYTATFYILAFFLTLILGVKGPGIIIFFSISVFVTLIQSTRAGFISVAINSILYLFFMSIVPTKNFHLKFFQDVSVTGWIGITINMIIFNALLVQSVSYLINQLNITLITETDLTNKLEEEGKELLIAKQKAEESDRLKSAFLSNVSHEIRTPLNAILGFGSLMNDDDVSREERIEYYEVIKSRSSDLLHIVNDILDVSKIEANQMVINPYPGNLKNTLNEIFETYNLKLKTENRNFELILNIELSEEECKLITDFNRYKQVLDNLIGNAFKFTDTGSITFGCRLIDNQQLLTYISDTGIGISEQDQKIIFDRFRQSEITISRVYGGTGLGLTISKGLVELLSGKIWLESKEQIGSSFYFTLPYIPVASELTEFESVSGMINVHNKKVLVVEDDKYNQKYLTKVLTYMNFDCLVADNGGETLKILENHSDIDLILMDIRLPDISGYELTTIIRKKYSKLPIIAQTGFAMAEDRQKCLEAGCNEVLSKPVSRESLQNMLKRFIN